MKILMLGCIGALALAAMQAVAQETAKAPVAQSAPAAASKPLSSEDEMEYLRTFTTYALSETQAYSAQSQLTAAQAHMNEVKHAYDTEQAKFTKTVQSIMAKEGCTEIKPNDGHPTCTLKSAASPPAPKSK